MIDKKEKKIINGYGTITVGAEYRSVQVTHIKPPQEIGEQVFEKDIETIKTVTFKNLTKNEIERVIAELEKVNEPCSVDFFDGWTLDFSDFNPKSVKVFIKFLKKSLIISQLALAC